MLVRLPRLYAQGALIRGEYGGKDGYSVRNQNSGLDAGYAQRGILIAVRRPN
jgi:hypothetical protein